MKIRAAVDAEAMSAVAERAIEFYLAHPEIVDDAETTFGKTHQVYSCPECSASVVTRDGELVSLRQQPGVLLEDELPAIAADTDESVLITA